MEEGGEGKKKKRSKGGCWEDGGKRGRVKEAGEGRRGKGGNEEGSGGGRKGGMGGNGERNRK